MTTKKKKKAKRKARLKRLNGLSSSNSSNRSSGTEKAPVAQQSSSAWQLRPNDGQGPYTSYFQTYVPRKIDPCFYEFMREAIPTIDAAIQRLTELDGYMIATGGNDSLVEEIQDWIDNITVNDIQTGLQAYDHNFTSEAHEQGFGIGEYVTNKKRNDIVGLRVADSKFIKFSRTDKGLDISQKGNDDSDYRVLKPDNLMCFSINNENQNPYGTSMMRSCEFVSKILVTIQNSELNVFERWGDPAYAVIYKTSKKDGTDHTAKRELLQKDLNTAITAKRAGKSADFVYVIDKESSINIEVIGALEQVLDFEIPSRLALEEIIAKTGLPAWMLGKHWSTTERLSDAEVNMIMAAVRTRQAAKLPLYKKLVRNLLLLRGRTWKRGDWDLEWAQVNLIDIEKLARANFLNSQAEMMLPAEAGKSETRNPKSEYRAGARGRDRNNQNSHNKDSRFSGSSQCTCGCDKSEIRNPKSEIDQKVLSEWHEKVESAKLRNDSNELIKLEQEFDTFGLKELFRTAPWPELDEVEDNFEKDLTYEWSVLEEQVFDILDLPTDGLVAVPKPTPREQQLTNPKSEIRNPKSKAPGDIPGIEAFTFSVEQQAAIMKSLEEFNGKYDYRDTDSAVRWYYGQSHSLGLIQAATLIGEDRPILDIIKNSETYDKLSKEGFKKIKDNSTKAIVTKIIPELEAQALAGTNPRHVASRLKARFGEANSDWERLARTEMTVAAERAKLDEWKQWDIDTTNAVIAGIDTHPRCRCSNTVEERSGKFVVVFVPAPDACPICLAAAN